MSNLEWALSTAMDLAGFDVEQGRDADCEYDLIKTEVFNFCGFSGEPSRMARKPKDGYCNRVWNTMDVIDGV